MCVSASANVVGIFCWETLRSCALVVFCSSSSIRSSRQSKASEGARACTDQQSNLTSLQCDLHSSGCCALHHRSLPRARNTVSVPHPPAKPDVHVRFTHTLTFAAAHTGVFLPRTLVAGVEGGVLCNCEKSTPFSLFDPLGSHSFFFVCEWCVRVYSLGRATCALPFTDN